MQKSSDVMPLVIGGAVAIGLIVLLSKSKQTPGTNNAATVQLAIKSNGISGALGDDLVAGQSYTLSTTVTNQSTLSGAPIPANFTFRWGGNVVNTTQSASFAASQSQSFSTPFTIPGGMAGSTATFSVTVTAPNGVVVATDSIQATVVAAPTPLYAATAVVSY